MNKKYFINWSIWIGVWSGVYVFLYVLSPLAQYGMLPATFVGLPIYFLSGAKKEEFLDFSLSAVGGVCWALLYLFCIQAMLDAGMSAAVSNGVVVGVLTIALCAIHFILPPPFCTKIPMMFGAIAFTFITGAAQPVAVMITFVLGICLAFLCNFGIKFLDENGNWNFGAKKS